MGMPSTRKPSKKIKLKIKLRGEIIELKWGIRSMMAYEQIRGGISNDSAFTITDMIQLAYAIIISSNSGKSPDSTPPSFDDLLDFIDKKPEWLEQFSEWLVSELGVEVATPRMRNKT